jgi:hypothetical protein
LLPPIHLFIDHPEFRDVFYNGADIDALESAARARAAEGRPTSQVRGESAFRQSACRSIASFLHFLDRQV